jgi:hypothetical protein
MRLTEEYMKSDTHRANLAVHCPDFLKRNTLRVLLCYVPGPLGLGLNQRRAGEFLGLHFVTVCRILADFKDRFPSAWESIQSMRRVMERQRLGLINPISLDRLIRSMGEEGVQNIMSNNNVLEELNEDEE